MYYILILKHLSKWQGNNANIDTWVYILYAIIDLEYSLFAAKQKWFCLESFCPSSKVMRMLWISRSKLHWWILCINTDTYSILSYKFTSFVTKFLGIYFWAWISIFRLPRLSLSIIRSKLCSNDSKSLFSHNFYLCMLVFQWSLFKCPRSSENQDQGHSLVMLWSNSKYLFSV